MADLFSYWEKSSYWQDADVAIIGSGITGLSAAIYLKKAKPNFRVVVLERGIIPHGASSRNAGFACFGSVSELMDDIQQRSWEATLQLVERRYKGLLNLRQLIGDKNMHYESCGGFEVFDNKTIFEKCEDLIPVLNVELGKIIGFKDTYTVQSDKIKASGLKGFQHCICNKAEGQLHSGHLMENLTQLATELGVKIFTQIQLIALEENGNGYDCILSIPQTLKARNILIATNGFAKTFLPEEEIQPARGQIIVTSIIPQLALKGSFHYDAGYYYFRNIGQRVLLGGGRNLDFSGENTTEMALSKVIQEQLLNMLTTKILPDIHFEIEHRWSGIMGVGGDRHPIIKQLNKNLFAAVKMGGMGVAIGTLAGKEVAQLIIDNC